MTSRRARIQKVVEHRTEQLEAAVGALGEARNRELEAKQALSVQRDKVRLATEQRASLSHAEVTVQHWLMADDWLKTQNAFELLAQKALIKASHVVEQARQGVLHARNELRRVEALVTRLEKQEREQAERAERKLHDELAAQRFAHNENQKEDR